MDPSCAAQPSTPPASAPDSTNDKFGIDSLCRFAKYGAALLTPRIRRVAFDTLMTSAKTESSDNTRALFARVSRNSENVFVPINDSAVTKDSALPAFYCVHDITGAAASDYIDLARRLNATVRFYGIQSPKKKMQDTEFGQSIESIAGYYFDALRNFQPQGAIILGGFCAGGLIALEMAQRLRAAGRNVALLVAIDAVLETLPPKLPGWHPVYVMKLIRNLPAWIRHGGLTRQRDSYSLPWRIVHNAVLRKITTAWRRDGKQGRGYTADGVMDLSRFPSWQKEFINRFYAACFEYLPKNYLGDAVFYEPSVTPIFYLPQPGSRWLKIVSRVEVVRVTGTHFTMMREPYVKAIAQDLERRVRVAGLGKNAHVTSPRS